MKTSTSGDTGIISMITASIIYRIIIITGKAKTLYPVYIIHSFKIYIIINSGVISDFIDYTFLFYYNLENLLEKKPYRETLILADGRTQLLMHIITLMIIINSDYIKIVVFTAVNVNTVPAVLGIIWFELYNLWINWRCKIIEFLLKTYYMEYRLLGRRALDVHNVVDFFILSVPEYYCNGPWPGLYYSRPLAGTYPIGLIV